MKKNTINRLLLTAFTAFSVASFAQEKIGLLSKASLSDHRTCGLEQHEQELLKNPEYAASFYERKAKVQQRLNEIHQKKMNGTYQKRDILYIPVAVHFPGANESDRACLETYAQTQIDVINDDYNATNADISNWADASTYYPGMNPGSVDVKFCIATTNHPATADPQVADGNPLVTIGTGANGSSFGNWPESDTRYAQYMNFIIKDTGAGNLGYSPLTGNVANGMAVVMNTICYGTGAGCPTSSIVPGAPYNLGRTVTHELGHFFGLNHTFIVDGGTSCAPADGDGIADTPKVAGSTYGAPANGSVDGCVAGEKALTMNYMDYVNDASMYMFTPDQATIVEAFVTSQTWRANAISCETTDPIISFASIQQAVTEDSNCSHQDVTVTLRITEADTANADVTITATGSATGADYTIMGGNVTFPINNADDQTATIRIYNDSFVEVNEEIILGLNLTSSNNAVIASGASSQQIITINNDDVATSATTVTTLLSEDGNNLAGWSTIDSDGDSNNWGLVNGVGGLGWFGLTDPVLFSESDLTVVGGTGTTDPDNYFITSSFTFPSGASSIDLSYALAGYTTSEPYVLYFATDTTNETTIQAGTILASGSAAAGDPGALTNVSVPLGLAGQTGALVMIHDRTDALGSLLFWDTITLSATSSTGVQTLLNSGTPDINLLGSAGTVYTANTADGNVMADITNTNGVDYGCVNTYVSRATGAAQQLDVVGAANFVMGKTFTITPGTIQVGGNATLKFYLTTTEVNQWITDTASGYTVNDLMIIKDNGVGNKEAVAATVGAFGPEITLEGTFTDGINGTYYFGKMSAILGVSENQFNVFSVYPNPSNGIFNLSVSTVDDAQVKLFDIRGRNVYSKLHANNSDVFNTKLDFSSLASGVYMLDVESGSKRAVKKIVIQ